MTLPRYRLRVPDPVADSIRNLHPQIKRKLRESTAVLAANPGAGNALKDELAGLWSFRIGKFKLIYRIADSRTLDLVAFGPRERIYEETYRLIARSRLP